MIQKINEHLAIISPDIDNADDIARLYTGLTDLVVAAASTDPELYLSTKNGICQVMYILQAILPTAPEIDKYLNLSHPEA